MIKERAVQQASIFIVEDELLLMEVTRMQLSHHFNNIETYSDGLTAFEAIKEKKPSIVILDVMLPGMGGFEILEKIKKSDSLSAIKVIMVTAKYSDKDVEKGFNLGADEYLNKPFKHNELINRIQKLLKTTSGENKDKKIIKRHNSSKKKPKHSEAPGQIRTEQYTVPRLSCHLIWVTKYRHPTLQGDIKERCRELIKQICEALEMFILEGIVKEDYIRLHIAYTSKQSVDMLVNQLKDRTSELLQQEFLKLHEKYWGQLIWATGYGAWSTGKITDNMINAYIDQYSSDKNENSSDFILE